MSLMEEKRIETYVSEERRKSIVESGQYIMQCYSEIRVRGGGKWRGVGSKKGRRNFVHK